MNPREKVLLYAALGLGAYLVFRNADKIAKSLAEPVGRALVEVPLVIVKTAANTVVDVANDPASNPFYDFGTWLGGKIYDMTHEPYNPNLTQPSDVRGLGDVRTLKRGRDGVYR